MELCQFIKQKVEEAHKSNCITVYCIQISKIITNQMNMHCYAVASENDKPISKQPTNLNSCKIVLLVNCNHENGNLVTNLACSSENVYGMEGMVDNLILHKDHCSHLTDQL